MKRVARERNTTVSSLFEDWGTRVLAEESAGNFRGLGDELLGKWTITKDQYEEDARMEYLLEKHGK